MDFRVSVRETKLVLDRLLFMTGLDRRLVPAVRDVIIAAELVGSGGFDFVAQELLEKVEIPTPRLEVVEERPGLLVVDCQEQYAAAVGPSLLDLVTLRAQQQGVATLLVRGLRYPNLLHGLVPLADRRGLVSLVVTDDGQGGWASSVGFGTPVAPVRRTPGSSPAVGDDTHYDALLTATAVGQPALPEDEDPQIGGGAELWDALTEGIPVASERWWSFYHRSNEALTRTSEISRQHAGAPAGTEV